MSEKKQGTTQDMRLRMLNRYGDDLHHKHDKNHNQFRKHFKSHPVQIIDGKEAEEGHLKELNLSKVRIRQGKKAFH